MSRLKVFVINRARDTERLESVKAQLDRLGLPFERIAAVEGAGLTEQAVTGLVKPRLHRLIAALPGFVRRDESGLKVFMPEHYRYLVAAEIACYLSHQHALESLIAADAKAGVIFEDDVGIDDDLPVVLDAAQALGPRALIVKLEGVHAAHRVNLQVARAGARDIALMLKPTTGAAAYFLTRAAAIRVRARMSPIREPYDAYLRQYWKHGIEVLEVAPFPVRQLQFATTIPGRRDQPETPAIPALNAVALALAKPLLKAERLLRRGGALAKRAHRLGGLRTGQKTH